MLDIGKSWGGGWHVQETLKSMQFPPLKSCILNEVLKNYTSYVVLIRVLQRNRINKMCIYREIYFKELAHGIVEAAKVRDSTGWASRRETQEGVAIWVQRPSAGRIPFSPGQVSLFKIKAFNRLDEAHHIMEGNLLNQSLLI